MRRVVKVGGSLLSRVDLNAAMSSWLDHQSPAQNLVVVGGGERVDAVRQRDRVSPGETESVHWECIALLGKTFEQASVIFPNWKRIQTDTQLSSLSTQGVATHLVAVDAFYNRSIAALSPLANSLPRDWTTTSDALAALLAIASNADELVILKSCSIPRANVHELADLGIVDSAFPTLASRVKRWRLETLAL